MDVVGQIMTETADERAERLGKEADKWEKEAARYKKNYEDTKAELDALKKEALKQGVIFD